MNIFWALIMGVTQGLTEFFPVSSSAHLTLFPWIFRFADPGLSFDIALHAGTLLAIVVALWSDWMGILRALFKKQPSFEKKLILFLLLTSIPGALFGYFLEDQAQTIFRTPGLIATSLIVFGLVLCGVDRFVSEKDGIEKMTTGRAALIGLAQGIAIIPGVSRSGATITAGRALGFSRTASVKYSFLAAGPIIFGAVLFGLRKVPLSDLASLPWVIGFLAALASSLLAMKLLLSWVQKKSFGVFLWYRVGFSILVFILLMIRR